MAQSPSATWTSNPAQTIKEIIFKEPSSPLVGTPSQTVLAHQRPLIHQLKRKKNAWWTLSPSASKRTLFWWPIVKGRVGCLGSRSCPGLLWATGSKASCSPGCTARQAAWPSVVWWQHGVSEHKRLMFDSLQRALLFTSLYQFCCIKQIYQYSVRILPPFLAPIHEQKFCDVTFGCWDL